VVQLQVQEMVQTQALVQLHQQVVVLEVLQMHQLLIEMEVREDLEEVHLGKIDQNQIEE
tara:strand:- start:395 stop:571 length:177 start_codon:yes stop_codon:yes gene_type:complete